MKLLQRPLSWLVLLALCALGVVYARRNFSKAIPLLRLDISMNRQAASAAAVDLARKHGWSPAEPRRSWSLTPHPSRNHEWLPTRLLPLVPCAIG